MPHIMTLKHMCATKKWHSRRARRIETRRWRWSHEQKSFFHQSFSTTHNENIVWTTSTRYYTLLLFLYTPIVVVHNDNGASKGACKVRFHRGKALIESDDETNIITSFAPFHLFSIERRLTTFFCLLHADNHQNTTKTILVDGSTRWTGNSLRKRGNNKFSQRMTVDGLLCCRGTVRWSVGDNYIETMSCYLYYVYWVVWSEWILTFIWALKKQERQVGCLILETNNHATISILRATMGCLGAQLSIAYPGTTHELARTRFIGWLERFSVSYQRLSDQHLVYFTMVLVLGHCNRCSPNFEVRPG